MCYLLLSIYAVLTYKKSILLLGLAVCLLLPACANSPGAQNLERSLAPDPSLDDGSLFGNGSSPGAETGLPANFPAEIPRYPNAEFVAATQPGEQADLANGAASATQTRWVTPDTSAQVEQFYREQFQSNGWQLIQPPSANPPNASGSSDANSPGISSPNVTGNVTNADADSTIVAERDGLRVTVNPGEGSAANGAETNSADADSTESEFTIDYLFSDNASVAQSPDAQSPVPNSTPSPLNPQPDANSLTAEEFTDLNQAPTELQPYITDLAKLGALRLRSSDSDNANNNNGNTNNAGGQFQPNSVTTRREYARWLVTANNLIYANQPARQIRLAVASDQPAFQDVPASDPDFASIQGLANAGLIPSPLSGDSTTVTFRPDAPLTRENLILWKVPVDLRKALPSATIESVQQTWGFQDTAQLDPKVLRALLADFQNGDQSNIRRAFGYTTIFQPDKSVTRAEAAAVLWYFGTQGDGVSAKDILQPGQQGG